MIVVRNCSLCACAFLLAAVMQAHGNPEDTLLQFFGDRPYILTASVGKGIIPQERWLHGDIVLQGESEVHEGTGMCCLKPWGSIVRLSRGEVQDLAADKERPIAALAVGQRYVFAFRPGTSTSEPMDLQAAPIEVDDLVRWRWQNEDRSMPLAALKRAIWRRQVDSVCGHADRQTDTATPQSVTPQYGGVMPGYNGLWLAIMALGQAVVVRELPEEEVKRLMAALLRLLDNSAAIADFSPRDGPIISVDHLAAELFGLVSYRHFGPGVPLRTVWEGAPLSQLKGIEARHAWLEQRKDMEDWWGTHRDLPREQWLNEGLKRGLAAATNRKLEWFDRNRQLTVLSVIGKPEVAEALLKLFVDSTEAPWVRRHSANLLGYRKDLRAPCPTEILVRVLTDRTEEVWVRQDAARLVGQLCDVSAAGQLLDFVEQAFRTEPGDRRVTSACIGALRQLSGQYCQGLTDEETVRSYRYWWQNR